MKAFSDKQLRFIELWTGVATETAALAGYKSPERASIRLMKNVRICQAIKEKRAAEIKPDVASRQERQKFWTDGMKNPELDYKDRLKASELLGKSEGDFLDRVENSGEIKLTIKWGD